MKEIRKFDFTSILGWSISRYDTFQSCKRKYYYTYYAKYDSSLPRQKIDELKKMTSIPLEIGNIVHKTIEVFLKRLLKSEDEIDRKRFLDYVHRKTINLCNTKVFAEVYYNEIPKINIDEVFDKVKNCLNNFLNSERFIWVTKETVSNKENWLIEPDGYGETRIDKMKAYCKVDFLFPVDNKLFILDWKTGKPHEEKHRKQLIGYSTWASFHFSKDLTDIVSIIAYLQPTYSEIEIIVNEFDVQEFSLQIKKETEEMYLFCHNIEENIPKDKEEFTKTNNQNICNYCNFREFCK